MPTCRLCNKDALHIDGFLARVNEKGVAGIWECRPSCDVGFYTNITFEDKLMMAIDSSENSK